MFFSSSCHFQIDVEPISVYATMSEEAFVGPIIGTAAIFVEGDVPEKEEVSVAIDTSMKAFFFYGVDVIVDAMGFTTATIAGEVSTEALVPPSELFLLRRVLSLKKRP